MSGVAGVLQFTGEPVDPTLPGRMARQMRHRGPDGQGEFLDGPLGLSHRLLNLGAAEEVAQPLHGGAGTPCIVFDGALTNLQALRESLGTTGHKFQTAGDAEVVLEGLNRHGLEFLSRMEGMFAFALWVPAEGTLFLCRDRLGIKPLYYALEGERLVFASEIRPLLEAGVEPVLDRQALHAWLRLRYVPGDRTLFQGIRRVEPGTWLRVRADGDLRQQVWWSLDTLPPVGKTDSAEAARRSFELLEQAVASHAQAHVPVSAFLSGGLDSSAIVALMRRGETPLSTFTFAMRGTGDESPAASRVASALGVENHVIPARPDDFLALKKAVLALEEPLGDAIIAPTWLLARGAGAHSRVVLSGEGADELMAGYVHHLVLHHLYRAVRLIPAPRRSALSRLLGIIPPPLWEQLFPYPGKLSSGGIQRLMGAMSAVDSPVSAACALVELFNGNERQQLLTPEFAQGDLAAAAWLAEELGGVLPGDSAQSSSEGDFLNALLRMDLKNWGANYTLLRLDKLSMAHGLQARVPFLDHKLVEQVQALPGALKIRGVERKRILRQALRGRGLVPESVRKAPKHPFYLDVATSFGPGFEAFVDELLSELSLRRRGIFNPSFVRHLRRSAGNDLLKNKQLMALIIFELWARLYLDGDWREASA